MYLKFAWRYFKAKKSTHAINIIAWVTTGVIAFSTCCQIMVLSVFNGFDGLVKSLYSSFYSDVKIVPTKGKTFTLDNAAIERLKKIAAVGAVSMIVEEKALIINDDYQTVVQLKGVDQNYPNVSGVDEKTYLGQFKTGTADDPAMIVGSGVQSAADILVNPALGPDVSGVILPKANVTSNDPLATISESSVKTSGVFGIQQDFDNSYAITNIDYIKRQIGLKPDEFTAAEIKLKPNADVSAVILQMQNMLGKDFRVQDRYQQNSSLYSTMQTEKWVIFAVLTLILIVAAFNMISAITMLVLEKKRDISILLAMGAGRKKILKIFLSEGLLLGIIGTITGVGMAVILCLIQIKFKLIKITGGTFIIDYFPVRLIASDFLLVFTTSLFVVLLASWIPSAKAARQHIELK
jgi:lipoprotein-releasing system permease protein